MKMGCPAAAIANALPGQPTKNLPKPGLSPGKTKRDVTGNTMADANQMRDPDYKPPLGEAIPLGVQHVLAMFAGNVTVPLIVALAAGPQYITVLVQISLLAAGVATLIQTIGIGPIGARLPIV